MLFASMSRVVTIWAASWRVMSQLSMPTLPLSSRTNTRSNSQSDVSALALGASKRGESSIASSNASTKRHGAVERSQFIWQHSRLGAKNEMTGKATNTNSSQNKERKKREREKKKRERKKRKKREKEREKKEKEERERRERKKREKERRGKRAGEG